MNRFLLKFYVLAYVSRLLSLGPFIGSEACEMDLMTGPSYSWSSAAQLITVDRLSSEATALPSKERVIY